MLRRSHRSLSASLLLLSLIACAAHAAELGEVRVASHIGQQLVADIELTLVEDASTKVEARLASRDVYSGAGIAVPPVLSTLNLSVMRRDGRQFLHATTLRPVEADHLHLYLELLDHGQRVVRLATLWLTPDPNPAPLPVSVPAPPSVAAVPAPAVAPAVASAPVAAPRTGRLAPAPVPAPTPTPVPAPVPAFVSARVETAAAHALPAAKPAPLPVHPAARPAACMPQSGEAEACVALGAKNAELRARIGQLEQRVKGLQATLGAGQGKGAAVPPVRTAVPPPPAHAAAPAAPRAEPLKSDPPKPAVPAQDHKPAPPPGPKPISSIKPLVPHTTPPPAADDTLPWGAIGGGLAALAALGGAAALLRVRRKRSRNVDIPDAPGVLPRLRERFFTRNAGGGATDPVDGPMAEPTLE